MALLPVPPPPVQLADLPAIDRRVEDGGADLEPRDPVARGAGVGRSIPAGASAVHGITDADVAGAPAFAAIAPDLFAALVGCDLAGFGIATFDVPLLVNEFARAGLPFRVGGRAVLDALAVYRRREPRDLTSAVQFYLGADPIPPRPSFWVQLKAKLAAARAAVTASVTPVVAEVSGRCRAATAAVASAVQTLGSAWQWKRIMLIGLGVGAATAAVAYLAPHALSATLAGVGATVTAVSIQAVAWLRRSARHTLGLA